jgi:hypothetical protein
MKNETEEKLFLNRCDCGNFHNWQVFRDHNGKWVQAFCLDCGKEHKPQ